MKKLISSILAMSMLIACTFTAAADTQKPQVTDFEKTGYKNTTVNFTIKDFNDHFTHEDAPDVTVVRIVTLPYATAGSLLLGDKAVEANQEIEAGAIDSLVFKPSKDVVGKASFQWQASNGTEYSENLAVCNITITDETPDPSASATSEPSTPASPEASDTATPDPAVKPLVYQDMMEGHWGAYSAGMLGTQGIIVGEEVRNRFYFYPEKQLNRIEFIIYTNGIFGVEPAEDLSQFPFSDEGLPGYIKKQAQAAFNSGIISGAADGDKRYLNPYDKLTRIECVTIINNALKVETPNTDPLDFADAADIPEWGVQAVKNMEGYGIIRGFEDNTLRPWSHISKAQAAEMLYQCQKYQKQRALTNQKYLPVSFMQ